MRQEVISLRMERQHLSKKANEEEYIALYRDLSPGYNVYWNGFGDPPTLSYRAGFDDMEYNRRRQSDRRLVKLRLVGGNLGWIMAEDIELFAGAYAKPLAKLTARQLALLELIEREGPLTIRQMKEITGLLVKEITPALSRLQEAFLVYEDQNEGQNDRGWYRFGEMFPDANLQEYTKKDALKALLLRFAFRIVWFDAAAAVSYFKWPARDMAATLAEMSAEKLLWEVGGGYLLPADMARLEGARACEAGVYALHRNDFLVKAYEPALKEIFPHSYPDTLYYLLIDGEFRGAAVGKFRYTSEVEDILVDLPPAEAYARKEEILQAVRALCGTGYPIQRYKGEKIQ